MGLTPLKIVLTAAGCPGAAALIQMVKANGEREVEVVGVDVRNDAIGRFLCDDFALVPPGSSDEFIPTLAAVVERERPDVLFVQSSAEILPVARARPVFEKLGARVLVASEEAIARCDDKGVAHEMLAGRVAQPEVRRPTGLDEFVAACRELGYPERPVCFKPPVSKGSRGFRVLRADVDRARVILRDRPSSVDMTLDEAVAAFRDARPFPRLLVMEYIDGPELVVDGLAGGGELLLHQSKTREAVETGLAMRFRTIESPELVEATREVCRALGLDWFLSAQYVGGKLIEVNARVSTFVYQEDFILPYLGIKYAMGELDGAALAEVQARVRTSRHTVRYYDQVFWDEELDAGSGTMRP